MTPVLGALHRYPLKSGRGEPLRSATVEPWGLAGDRRWMVVTPDGGFVTARELPRLLLVSPRLEGDAIRLTWTGAPEPGPIRVAAPAGGRRRVRVWRSEVEAADAGDEAADWLRRALGRDLRLVHLDDPRQRRPNPAFSDLDDRVSFADGYPLLLTTSASLAELDRWIAEGPRAAEGPIPMIRFRPNVVVDGTTAWEEDGWRRIRIGEAHFRVVKGCDRCAITTTDADSAARGKEPIATLARHRRFDGAVWFGMNLVPDSPGATLEVGAPVEVVEAVPAPDGPPR